MPAKASKDTGPGLGGPDGTADSKAGGPRNIIAYSLWGDSPKYVRGALDNARIAPAIYPGWTCRFYVGGSVPSEAVAELRSLPGVEVVQMDESGDLRGAFWRFAAAEDADVLLLRDADCRLSFPEKAAVDAWLESGLEGHTFSHYALGNLQAGTAGLRGRALRSLTEALAQWTPQDSYGDDEKMLRAKVLPDLKKRGQLLMHECSWGYGEPYPQPTADGSDLALTWQPDALFAQPYINLWWRHPRCLRHWYRRLGSTLCRAVKAVHPPAGRRLAWLLWRVLYGPPSPPVRLGLRIRERWRAWRDPRHADLAGQILDSLPQVQLPRRRIIAFPLMSDDPAQLLGAMDNALAAAEFFPGWTCRFFAHSAVPQDICERLAALPDTEVVRVELDPDTADPQLWGLAAAGDCDVLLLRSPLCRLSLLDRQVVAHWLASDKEIHSVHDHPDHRWEAPPSHLAGLRGAALQRATERGSQAGEVLAELAREMPEAWLRHDGQWHLGTPLPRPGVGLWQGHHGMRWSCSADYADLATPDWASQLRLVESRRDWRYGTAWMARRLLLPLVGGARVQKAMGMVCRALYGRAEAR